MRLTILPFMTSTTSTGAGDGALSPANALSLVGTSRVAVLEAALTTRREGLSEALRVEERKEELRSAFAAAAQEFVDYCQSQMDVRSRSFVAVQIFT